MAKNKLTLVKFRHILVHACNFSKDTHRLWSIILWSMGMVQVVVTGLSLSTCRGDSGLKSTSGWLGGCLPPCCISSTGTYIKMYFGKGNTGVYNA